MRNQYTHVEVGRSLCSLNEIRQRVVDVKMPIIVSKCERFWNVSVDNVSLLEWENQ